MTRTKAILLVCFLLTFAAGISVGLLAGRRDQPQGHHGELEKELNLTAAQQEKMDAIWKAARDSMRQQRQQQGDRRTTLSQDRDKKIAALLAELPDVQRVNYEAIQKDYSTKRDELSEKYSQERARSNEQVIEQTKKILTPDQAVKYEEILKRWRDTATSGPSAELPGGRRNRGGPTSRPTTKDTSTSHGEE